MGVAPGRGEQMNIRADLTDRSRRHCLGTNADRMSRGRRSKGEARSNADAVQSSDQRRKNQSTPIPNRYQTQYSFLATAWIQCRSQVLILIFFLMKRRRIGVIKNKKTKAKAKRCVLC